MMQAYDILEQCKQDLENLENKIIRIKRNGATPKELQESKETLMRFAESMEGNINNFKEFVKEV